MVCVEPGTTHMMVSTTEVSEGKIQGLRVRALEMLEGPEEKNPLPMSPSGKSIISKKSIRNIELVARLVFSQAEPIEPSKALKPTVRKVSNQIFPQVKGA